MTEASQRLRGLTVALVTAAAVAVAALTVAAVFALVDSPTISLELQRQSGVHGCHWSAHHGVCVGVLEGVRLGPYSLVREPEYLPDRGAFEVWRRHQDALYTALTRARHEGRPAILTGRTRRGEGTTLVADVGRVGLLGAARRVLGVAVTALSLLLIGGFVLVRRPSDAAARTLFAFCLALYLCLVPTMVSEVRGVALSPFFTRALWYVNLAGAAAASVALLHLTASFPLPRLGRATRALSLYAVGALSLGALALEAAGWLHQGTLWFLLGSSALALALVVFPQRTRAGQVQALQARWMRWGIAVPLVVVPAARLPMLLEQEPGARDPTDLVIVLSFLAFPAGVAAAILRDRLFDIEVVVRRTLLGAGVTATVIFGYYASVALFAGGLSGAPYAGGATAFFTALVLSLLFLPGQARLEGALDRVFFRNRYGYRRALATAPGDLASRSTSDDSVRHVLSLVVDAMEVRHAVIALAPECGEGAWTRGAVEPPDPDAWAQLRALSAPRLSDALAPADPLQRWMERSGLALALPLKTSDAFIGVMACATPSGAPALAADDIDLLHTVASALALALSRAQAYETVRRVNENLQALVESRTRELHEAQLKLFQHEKLASLGALAAGVAHELNSPLGVMVSTSELLVGHLTTADGEGDPPRPLRLARLCKDAADRASEIVKNLSHYTHPDQKDPVWADLRVNVESTLRVLRPSLDERRVTVRLALGEPPRVLCHPGLINQVLTNLIVNAAHASGEGGTITLTASRPDEAHLRLSVEDTGPGVDPSIRHRIFEPFFTTRPQGKGTGLGLSLCYAIVQHHGGRIWEDGEPGRGARFTLELPIEGPSPR